jgi:hypothetical protein
MLDSSQLRINRKTYYNLIYSNSFNELNNLFKGLILTLKKVNFRFNYRMSDKQNRRILKQVFFITNLQLV